MGPGGGDKTCYRCGTAGHISRDCPIDGRMDGTECYKCGRKGHIARYCQNAAPAGGFQGGAPGGFQGGAPQAGGFGGGAGGFGNRQMQCYSCGGYGHMSRDCTQGAKCYNCKSHSLTSLSIYIANIFPGGELGHISKDCPSEMSQERVCYRCKQPGHLQADCPA